MAKDIVAGFREVIQDLLVPELKALRAEFVEFKEEIRREFEQVDKRFEQVFEELKAMRQDMEQIKISQAEIISKLDIERRITKVETILEKILRKESIGEFVVKDEKSRYGKK